MIEEAIARFAQTLEAAFFVAVGGAAVAGLIAALLGDRRRDRRHFR